MSINRIFRSITLSRIIIIGVMISILSLITYYSSIRPSSTITPDTSSQTGESLPISLSGDDKTNETIVMTGTNHNTGAIALYSSKYFVETHEDSGSCTAVRVEDVRGNIIELPDEIEETLSCISSTEAFSHNFRFLLYSHSTAPDYKTVDLKVYDFKNNTSQTLMSFNNTMDGMSCQRRDDDSYIGCVVINQKEYAGSTKVFILQINANGGLVKKQVFPQTHDTRVGFHCASSCYPSDFRWEGTRTLQYEGQDNGDDILTGKTYSIKYE